MFTFTAVRNGECHGENPRGLIMDSGTAPSTPIYYIEIVCNRCGCLFAQLAASCATPRPLNDHLHLSMLYRVLYFTPAGEAPQVYSRSSRPCSDNLSGSAFLHPLQGMIKITHIHTYMQMNWYYRVDQRVGGEKYFIYSSMLLRMYQVPGIQ